nr:Carotenoid cleavage dioxygenase [Vector pRK-HIEBIYZ-FhCCD2]BDB95558.1 Carotenoid cleavage dioxygenase [Vector pRK-HIEBIYZ-FhCCD2-ALD8]
MAEKKKKKKKQTKVRIVDPKPRKGLLSFAVDLIEKALVYLLYGNADRKRHYYLSGNYAPVEHETPPCSELRIHGSLPECLNGVFLRVGPNPKFVPVAGYNWVDGDGMIHGLRIKDGKATYLSRYVKTSRFKQEEYFGGAKFMKIGDLRGFLGLATILILELRSVLKVIDVSYGTGTGNTALVYHNGLLLALSEEDKPYVVKVLEDGDLQTLGMLDYDNKLSHPLTAHPKIDPSTGEMFTFGYSLISPPYLTYRVVSKDGVMQDPVPISIPSPAIVHDFAITENYVIFMDLPLCFQPKEMVKGKLVSSFHPTKTARIGVLPRYAKDEHPIRWFELPSCFMPHNANAWEEDDEVVVLTCRVENPDLDMLSGPVGEEIGNLKSELYEMRFNLKTGIASQKQLSASPVDFPQINQSYTGRKHRYVYGTIGNTKITGIVKFDLHIEPEPGKTMLEVGGNVQGIFELGARRYGSEAIFVPCRRGITSDEDDGYLIFFVHDENNGKSEVNVIDAKTMSAEPVAVVELPSRVPYGFHALFLNEEELQKQQAAEA